MNDPHEYCDHDGLRGTPSCTAVTLHLDHPANALGPLRTILDRQEQLDAEQQKEESELLKQLRDLNKRYLAVSAERDRFAAELVARDVATAARKDLTEVRAEYDDTNGGTLVSRIAHHKGCALDLGIGECNCAPIRTSDFHTKMGV